MSSALETLDATIAARAASASPDSYVANLLSAGPERIARKLGEEAIECVIAALREEPEALTREAADLMFHLLVLLRSRGLSLADVGAELARREGVSGLAEKAGRAR